jgi:hypothetical protein
VSADVATLHSLVGTETRSDQVVVGLSHTIDSHWSFNGRLTHWKDTFNDVDYVGPSLGGTYIVSAAPEEDEIAAISLNSDFFFYETEARSSSSTIVVNRRREAVPARQGTVHVDQYHPSLQIETPLWDSLVTPYVKAGHSFYSRDPSAIEDLAGQPIFSAMSNRLNSLVSGFLYNDGEVGLRWAAPLRCSVTFELGADNLATDKSWTTLQSIGVSRLFWGSWRTEFSWTRTIQTGISNDLFAGTLAYVF